MRGFFSFEAWLKLGFGFCYMAYQVKSSYMLYVCVLCIYEHRAKKNWRERSSGVKTGRNTKNGSRERGLFNSPTQLQAVIGMVIGLRDMEIHITYHYQAPMLCVLRKEAAGD